VNQESLDETLEWWGVGPVLKMDGFDEAALGYIEAGDECRLVYGYDECIAVLEKEMSREDAIEYFEYNSIRSLDYMAKSDPPPPCVLRSFDECP
jgi:hypothetical protein